MRHGLLLACVASLASMYRSPGISTSVDLQHGFHVSRGLQPGLACQGSSLEGFKSDQFTSEQTSVPCCCCLRSL